MATAQSVLTKEEIPMACKTAMTSCWASCTDSLHCHGYKIIPSPPWFSERDQALGFSFCGRQRTHTDTREKIRQRDKSVCVSVWVRKETGQGLGGEGWSRFEPLLGHTHSPLNEVSHQEQNRSAALRLRWLLLLTKLQKSFFYQTNWFWLPLKFSAATIKDDFFSKANKRKVL